MGPKNTVIVPLYMYPLTAETFGPLHEAALAHPQLDFLVVLNPNSGPGASPWWPDARYVCEIPKLNAHANVCTLGYVRTDYCRRDLAETCRDIATYASWADGPDADGLFVQGIFFDEMPNVHTEDVAAYMETVNRTVKTAPGISDPRLTVHNPGTMPDEKLQRIGGDVTVVFEESLARYRGCNAQEVVDLHRFDWARCCIMLHTTPIPAFRAVVHEVRHRAKYLFVTDLQEDYYSRFGSGWRELISAVGS